MNFQVWTTSNPRYMHRPSQWCMPRQCPGFHRAEIFMASQRGTPQGRRNLYLASMKIAVPVQGARRLSSRNVSVSLPAGPHVPGTSPSPLQARPRHAQKRKRICPMNSLGCSRSTLLRQAAANIKGRSSAHEIPYKMRHGAPRIDIDPPNRKGRPQ